MNTIYHLVLLPWLVHLARTKLYGRTKDPLVSIEGGDTCDAEKLVRGATEATEVMVFARPDQMPADQVTGAVENRGDVAFAKEATLNDAVNGFKDIARIEFERASCV